MDAVAITIKSVNVVVPQTATKMSGAVKLAQASGYTKTETLATSLPKRRRCCSIQYNGFMSHGRVSSLKKGGLILTRCSTKPGIGSDNVASKNPATELDPNSGSRTSAAPALERALPSKYSKGLVFGLGSECSWDGAEVGSPVVRRYIGDDEERWYMWYHGRPDGEEGSDSIGLATSSNGICWARGSANVRTSGDVGKLMDCSSNWWAFDTGSVRPSDMVIMSSPMYSAVYWLYYTGSTEEEVELPELAMMGKIHKSLPGLACSQDGRNWARIEGDYHSGAVLDVGSGKEWDSLFIAAPRVVVHSENDLRMYYHSYDAEKGHFAIGLARSRDGIRWVKLGKIMGSGEQGFFDELGVLNGHVVREAKEGRYLMAYEGVSRCGKRSIGLAASQDGLKNWTRLQHEPVLQPSDNDGWDNAAVSSPCLVQMEGNADQWRLYYKGIGHQGRTGIGMAVSGGTDISQFSRWEGFHL